MGDLLDQKSQDIIFDIPKVADLWVSHVQHAIENLEIFWKSLDIFVNLWKSFGIWIAPPLAQLSSNQSQAHWAWRIVDADLQENPSKCFPVP